MAASAAKQYSRGTAIAALACLCLLAAGCGPGPPRAFPPFPAPGPGISGPKEGVHFTAQGDIGVQEASRQVLDTVAGLRPQFNLALGDLSYRPAVEQEFCDMVTGKLGEDFPYQLIT